MDFPVEMVLPPRTAARGDGRNKGQRAFLQADDALTAYVVDRVTKVSADGLDEEIDLILEDQNYQEMRRAVTSQVPWEMVISGFDRLPEPPQFHKVPTVVVDRVATALRLEFTLFRCVVRHLVQRETATDRIPLVSPSPDPIHPAMDFNQMVPHPVRAAILGQKIGEICGRALLSERIVSSALANALVERWTHGLWGMLGFLAMIDLLNADKIGLPERYRLDRDRVFAEFFEQRDGLVAALAEVEASGKGFPQVYLPDEEEDDDERGEED
jgi:hypothetical protein